MRLLIFNLWHKKRQYKTIHTLTKRIRERTTDNDNNNKYIDCVYKKAITITIVVVVMIM